MANTLRFYFITFQSSIYTLYSTVFKIRIKILKHRVNPLTSTRSTAFKSKREKKNTQYKSKNKDDKNVTKKQESNNIYQILSFKTSNKTKQNSFKNNKNNKNKNTKMPHR